MHRLITTSLTAGLAAAAIAAPTASAIGPVPPRHDTKVQTTVVHDRTGSDWGVAAMGAGGAAVLTLLAVGGLGLSEGGRLHTAD